VLFMSGIFNVIYNFSVMILSMYARSQDCLRPSKDMGLYLYVFQVLYTAMVSRSCWEGVAKFLMWFSFISILGFSFVRCTNNRWTIRIVETLVVVVLLVLLDGATFKSVYSCKHSIFSLSKKFKTFISCM
jgi:hypothetical protein